MKISKDGDSLFMLKDMKQLDVWETIEIQYVKTLGPYEDQEI